MLNLEWIGPFMQDFSLDQKQDASIEDFRKSHMQKLTDNDELKAFTLLSKPYLEEIYLNTAVNENEHAFKERLKKYKCHLV